MLIIEGCDKAGKTTFAKDCVRQLQTEHGLPMMYSHFDKPPANFDKYWGYEERVCPRAVMDRFHMSHLAYRAVDGEPHDLTPLTYSMVDAEITRHAGLVVLLLPSPQLVRDRWGADSRDEMYGLEHVLKVNEVFHEMQFARWNGYLMKVDFRIVLTPKSNPDLIQSLVTAVCQAYASAQEEHDRILKRRPLGR